MTTFGHNDPIQHVCESLSISVVKIQDLFCYFVQACCQAESMIVPKKWLTKIELNKIKAECKDECCNPAGSSTSAPISEAATEHSEIRRLLNLASENSQSSEAATEHFKIPEAACLETKRPRKSGKGSFSQTQKMMFPATNANPGA